MFHGSFQHRLPITTAALILAGGLCGQGLPSLDQDFMVTFSGLIFNRSSNTFDTQAGLNNVSSQTLTGTFSMVITSISTSGVTLANATCLNPQGQPVLVGDFGISGLAPHQILSMVLKFSNPAHVGFTFTETLLAGNACALAATVPVLHSYSDSQDPPDQDTMNQILTLAQGYASTGCPAAIAAQSMTLADAKASLAQRLDQFAGAGSLESFLAGAASINPENLTAMGASATVNEQPYGAVAAFSAAAQNEPQNPAHLVNAAASANLLGMPNEALALLDAADALHGDYGSPMGINGQAAALNNRAFALLLVGQKADAQAAASQALGLEP